MESANASKVFRARSDIITGRRFASCRKINLCIRTMSGINQTAIGRILFGSLGHQSILAIRPRDGRIRTARETRADDAPVDTRDRTETGALPRPLFRSRYASRVTHRTATFQKGCLSALFTEEAGRSASNRSVYAGRAFVERYTDERRLEERS